MDQFMGEIRAFGLNYAPQGWAICNGALMSIAQNTALYSLLGTMYGGDGRSTFALPNLQGRISVGVGQGAGLSPYTQGQVGGSTSVTLLPAQMPAHTHSLPTTNGVSSTTPGPAVWLGGAGGKTGTKLYDDPATQAANSVTMAANLAGIAGGSQAHNNMAPYLVLTYCIALQGIYPQRP